MYWYRWKNDWKSKLQSIIYVYITIYIDLKLYKSILYSIKYMCTAKVKNHGINSKFLTIVASREEKRGNGSVKVHRRLQLCKHCFDFCQKMRQIKQNVNIFHFWVESTLFFSYHSLYFSVFLFSFKEMTYLQVIAGDIWKKSTGSNGNYFNLWGCIW